MLDDFGFVIDVLNLSLLLYFYLGN